MQTEHGAARCKCLPSFLPSSGLCPGFHSHIISSFTYSSFSFQVKRSMVDMITLTHLQHPFYDSGRLPPTHMMMRMRRGVAESAGFPMLDMAGEDIAEI